MQVKILLTGGDGLIGKELINNIQKSDLNVDLFLILKSKINHSFNVSKIFYCDLINDNLKESLFEYSFDYIIHLASIAHAKDSKKVFDNNILMTSNLIKSVNRFSNFIFFSSISVYGECKKSYPVMTSEKCIPYSYYAKSKLYDEKFLKNQLKNLFVLRLCPMISGNSKDLKKRIFLPMTKIKYKSPYSRQYSFSTHDSIWKVVKKILNNQIDRKIINVSDNKFYSEKDILEKFEGKSIKIPLFFTNIIFKLLDFLSFISYFYKVKCLIWKMLKANTYSNENY